MKADRFYTPTDLAEYLVQSATVVPQVVADFAAGDGALLRAAARRWPDCELIATDIDARGLKSLPISFKTLVTGRCNFVSRKSRRGCAALVERKASVQLVLLNPPFSCRGGSKTSVELEGELYEGSLALSFVAISLSYVETCGQIVAILPASCVDAQKDRELWAAIRRVAAVEIIQWQGYRTFSGCSARTCAVRITKRRFGVAAGAKGISIPLQHQISSIATGVKAYMFRGHRAIHEMTGKLQPRGVPFVHTTNMSGNRLQTVGSRVRATLRDIKGPAVLVPRVGRPELSKICLLRTGESASLSDCVIALVSSSEYDTDQLFLLLTEHWPTFSQLCRGTGAPYLTVEALAIWLIRRGVLIYPHPSASSTLKKILSQLCQTQIPLGRTNPPPELSDQVSA